MDLAREYELVSRIAELEKRVAALEEREQPQLVTILCDGEKFAEVLVNAIRCCP